MFCSLALLFTIFRIFTLHLIRRNQHAPEHYLAILGMLLLLASSILAELATIYGKQFVNSVRNYYTNGTPIDFQHQGLFTNLTVG